ncbi:MAG: hypothetical protein ABFE07_29225 [Armatimonadia bacterium]
MATGNIAKPDVFIKEEFVTTSPTLVPPALPVCLVGTNRQVAYKQSAGAYAAVQALYEYPDLPLGASVVLAGVKAYLINQYGTFELAGGDYSAAAGGVTVEANAAITRNVVPAAGSGETTNETTIGSRASDGVSDVQALTFNSAGSTFLTDGVKPGMSLEITSGDDEGIYEIAAVNSETQLTVKATPWTGFTLFTGDTSLVFRVLADGSVFTDDAADFLDDGVTAGMDVVITSGANAGTWRVEEVVSDVALRLKQELIATDHTGSTGTGNRTFTDTGRDFTTLGVKAGDKLVVEDGTDAGTYVISTVGTTTLTVTSESAFSGDATCDYRIVRVFTVAANVPYRVDYTDNAPSGTILLSYTAKRTDNVDALVTLETQDDVVAKLGPIVPANPLAFAAWLALQNTGTTVYATAVEDDEVADHTAAAEFLETREVYSIVPLSQLPEVHQIWKSNVDTMSTEANKHERIAFINRLLFVSETKATGTSGYVPAATTFSADDGDFINDEVAAGMMVKILDNTGAVTESARVLRVVSATELELVAPGLTTESYHTLDYRIDTYDLDKAEQADFLADYSVAFADRRVFNVWPDLVQIAYTLEDAGDDTFATATGEVTADLPGYFACAIVGAMKAGYAPQQPFTNVPMTGLVGLQHSNEYFSPTQLDVIATGGTYILVQDAPTAPCYCRHQLSTDVTSIEKRELSICSDVDYVAKFLRNQLRPYIGRYNITPTLLETLRSVTDGVLKFLKAEGQLMETGTKLVSLVQSESQPDTVEVTIQLDVPYPCNYIRVTLVI